MLKSNRVMFFLLALAIFVMVLGQSVNAASCENADNITVSSEQTCADVVPDQVDKMEAEPHIKKDLKENSKESPELEDISLSMEDVEVNYGDHAELSVLTTPVVDEGLLSFYINQHIVNVRNLSISSATASLNTNNYDPGNYTVEVIYSGSLIHNTASTSATLTINPGTCSISNIETEFNEENDIDVKLNILDQNGIVYWGTVNVYNNDDELIKSVQAEDYDDDIFFSIDKRYNNEVLIFEYVDEDGYYNTSRTSYYVNLAKYRANMYIPYPSGYYGSSITQPVTFYTNRPINDGILDVYVDGDLIDEYMVSSANVDVNFDLNEYSAGTYTVFLDYYGSDVYEDATYTTTLTVRQVSTTLYTYNVTGHKNDSVLLRGGVYNFVDDTSEGLIEFFIDNVSVQTAWISHVNANVSYVIPDNLDYGEHELRVVYYGSQRYAPANGVAVLNVVRHSNSLSVRNTSLDSDGHVVIYVREYSYNQTVDDGMLEYYVDGVLVGSTPVTGNITMIVLPDTYHGDTEYELTINFMDSDKFDNATLTTTLNVPKINTTNRLYAYVNGSNILNITSYIYGTNYANISEGTVNFYINNTLIGTQNVENNMANIFLDLNTFEDKTYNIRTEYTGSNLYKTSQNNTSINYTRNKKQLYIQTTSTINEKPGNQITINVNLTDNEANNIPLQTYINLTILGNEYPVWTENGQISFTYNIPSNTTPGTYNITIKTGENDNYKEANRTIRLNIYKDTPYITGPNTIRTNKGETILINATLNLNREKLIENITGLLKINGKTIHQGIFQNGEFQYKLVLNDKYTNDQYNITIVSIETSQYYRAEKEITLNLNSRNTYITSQNIESKNGEQIIINATIYDATTRTPVQGTGKVCIKINDKTLDNIIVNDGKLIYTYTNDYSAKDYSIKIVYGKNGIYNNSTWNGTLTIKSSKLQIATHNIQSNAYSTINIKANILSDNKLATGPVNTAIKINNKTIHEETVNNGKLSFNYTLPSEIGSGTYNLTIIAGDSRKYTSNTTTVNLTVTKNYKQIETNKITTTSGETITIKARLVDKTGNIVTVPTKINIKIAGHTITDYNITDGNIEYNYTLPETYTKGNYDLLIQAGETSGYYHAATITTLKIE